MGFGCSSESKMQVAVRSYINNLHKDLDMTDFCKTLVKEDIVGSDAAAQVFGDVFKNGVVTAGERLKLRLSGGLSAKDDAELSRLVGQDGADPLHLHAIWLADHAVKQTFRNDESVEDRVAMLHELSALYTMNAKPLTESSFNEVIPFLIAALQASELVTSAMTVLGAMGAAGLGPLQPLLKDPRKQIRLHTITVLSGMGRAALPVIPSLKQVVRDDRDADVRKSAGLAKDRLELIGK